MISAWERFFHFAVPLIGIAPNAVPRLRGTKLLEAVLALLCTFCFAWLEDIFFQLFHFRA